MKIGKRAQGLIYNSFLIFYISILELLKFKVIENHTHREKETSIPKISEAAIKLGDSLTSPLSFEELLTDYRILCRVHQKEERKKSDFAVIETESLTMQMNNDFKPAWLFYHCTFGQGSWHYHASCPLSGRV